MTRHSSQRSQVWQRITLSILIIGCVWGFVLASPGRADIRLESRVNSLEYQLRLVQSELSRLFSTVRSQPIQPSAAAPPVTPDPSGSGAYLSLDQQFDNLATLVIELKEDVRALQERVAALEQR